MRSRVDRLIARATFFLYGAISLCGYGLHALPHCCSGVDCGEVAHAHDHHAHGHHGHDHSSPHGHHDHAHPQENSTPGSDHNHDPDHCLICQFQALSQHAPPPLAAVVCGAVSAPAPIPIQFSPQRTARSYDSRGPPLAPERRLSQPA